MTKIKCIVDYKSFFDPELAKKNKKCFFADRDGICRLEEISLDIILEGDGGYSLTTFRCNDYDPIGEMEFGI